MPLNPLPLGVADLITESVLVSNDFGVVTSTPAMLNVIPAVERRPFRSV